MKTVRTELDDGAATVPSPRRSRIRRIRRSRTRRTRRTRTRTRRRTRVAWVLPWPADRPGSTLQLTGDVTSKGAPAPPAAPAPSSRLACRPCRACVCVRVRVRVRVWKSGGGQSPGDAGGGAADKGAAPPAEVKVLRRDTRAHTHSRRLQRAHTQSPLTARTHSRR